MGKYILSSVKQIITGHYRLLLEDISTSHKNLVIAGQSKMKTKAFSFFCIKIFFICTRDGSQGATFWWDTKDKSVSLNLQV